MRRTVFLFLLVSIFLFKATSAEMDVGILVNNFGESINMGLYADYSEFINDHAKVRISFYAPTFIYTKAFAQFDYLAANFFKLIAGSVFIFEPDNHQAGVNFGFGFHTTKRNFFVEFEATLYTGLTNSFEKQNMDLQGKIGWEGTNFKTFFAYKFERKNDTAGILFYYDHFDFHLRFFDSRTPIFGELDASTFTDLRTFNIARIKFFAKLKLGFVRSSGGDYYMAVEFNQKNTQTANPLGISLGWKNVF
ncbi:MAG: hypothetical protein ACRC4W_02985 [Treponemataceae bacterium]